MKQFVEGIWELLFGPSKNAPNKMPEIEYKDSFIIKHNPKKIIMRIVLSFLVVIAFTLLFILGHNNALSSLYIFVIFVLIISGLALSTLFYRCIVTEETLSSKFLIFYKRINWADIICVRKCENTKDNSTFIALYNSKRKCVLDISSEMENAWYVIKMAEHKNIEIRTEKDLSLKQINQL